MLGRAEMQGHSSPTSWVFLSKLFGGRAEFRVGEGPFERANCDNAQDGWMKGKHRMKGNHGMEGINSGSFHHSLNCASDFLILLVLAFFFGPER